MVETVNYPVNSRFVWNCLRTFCGKAWPVFLLFAAGMAIVLLLRFRKKYMGGGFALCSWTLILTAVVYNPLIVKLFVPRIVEKAIYYRLFWLLPAIPGAAWVITEAISLFGKRWQRYAAGAAAMILLLVCLPTNASLMSGFEKPDNIYKVPDGVVYACDVIHDDFGESDNLPRTIWAFELEIYVRQYNPGIKLCITRNFRLRYAGSQMVGENSKKKKIVNRITLLNGINSTGDVDTKSFRTALKKMRVDYLIIPDDYDCHEFLEEAGCKVVGEGHGVSVFRHYR